MGTIAYPALLPAENPAHFGASLNVLVVAENKGPACRETVRFYASDGGPAREIWAEERPFPQGHPHLYFNLPASCFAPSRWGGQPPEELTLWVGSEPPLDEKQGVLLFFTL